jgi:hypothetical protein
MLRGCMPAAACLGSATDQDRDIIQEKLARAEEGLAADEASAKTSAAQGAAQELPGMHGCVCIASCTVPRRLMCVAMRRRGACA